MINFNQQILPKKQFKLNLNNRAFKYGDGIFDTLKYAKGRINFLEDHYFRLMSSMRMLRMKIPMNFTLKFYKDEIIKTIQANGLLESSRVRVSIFRKEGGLYAPVNKGVDMLIEANELIKKPYDHYEIELYKDMPVYSGILSNIKTNNRIINVVASIFASEFNYQNCVLINEKKNIVEANNANIFLIKGNNVFTPALTEGCIDGILRKKIIEMIDKNSSFNIIETEISPFELLKSDEVFISNSIIEIQSVTKYRKKNYAIEKTQEIIKMLKIFTLLNGHN